MPPVRPARLHPRRLPLPCLDSAEPGSRRRGTAAKIVDGLAAEATLTAAPLPEHAATLPDRLESIGILALLGVAAFVQFSIAISQSLLAIAILCWAGVVATRHERVPVPRFFWLLLAYAGATLVSSVSSSDPRTSLGDSKQLVLFSIVPVTYRFISVRRTNLLLTLVMSLGAASAALGIF